MPTYEFRCPEGHDFEKFYRSIGAAESQAVCPQCGKTAARIMSPTGFSFKGSGFYLTDYGKNAHRDRGADARPAAASDNGAKPEAKTDAKGDAGSGAGTGGTPAASPSSDAKPTAKAEPKPAAAPAKKSSAE